MAEEYKSSHTGAEIDNAVTTAKTVADVTQYLTMLQSIASLDSGLLYLDASKTIKSIPLSSSSTGNIYVDNGTITVGTPPSQVNTGETTVIKADVTSMFIKKKNFAYTSGSGTSKKTVNYAVDNFKVIVTVTGRQTQIHVSFTMPKKMTTIAGNFKNKVVAELQDTSLASIKKLYENAKLTTDTLKPTITCALSTMGAGPTITGFITSSGIGISSTGSSLKAGSSVSIGGSYIF